MVKYDDWLYVRGNAKVRFTNRKFEILDKRKCFFSLDNNSPKIKRHTVHIEVYLNYFIENFDDGSLLKLYREQLSKSKIYSPKEVYDMILDSKYRFLEKIRKMVDLNIEFKDELSKNIMMSSFLAMLALPFTLLDIEFKPKERSLECFNAYTLTSIPWNDYEFYSGSMIQECVTNRIDSIIRNTTKNNPKLLENIESSNIGSIAKLISLAQSRAFSDTLYSIKFNENVTDILLSTVNSTISNELFKM